MHHRPLARRTALGFTLVELLVVIAVIALLVGILLPVLGAARTAAKTAACMANMRSLGQATVAYTQDHALTYPQPFQEGQLGAAGGLSADRVRGRALWYNALDRYLGQVVKDYSSADPAARNHDAYKQDPVWFELPAAVKSGATTVLLQPEEVRTIKMNQYFGEIGGSATAAGAVNFVRMTRVPEPARTVLYGDGRAHDTPSTTSGNVDTGGSGRFDFNPATIGLRHGGGANLAFADGGAAYQENPVRVTATGYRGWFDPYASGVTPGQYPDAIFRFEPDRTGQDRIRARGGNR
ncbi:type II secretion system protein [Phycisphaera mikurensis]|uniref:Prepilin-type N-terminal cleavage/methylation domain-containing protein n=1 Tax=Phycisphaera mikurensis (strain NBRC 102666 / KCTC 22515 / FYK2301M01) TaxID=1142394 RepID=I0IGR6_PHYMF|nr:prepilin-type N-terminal cleavage/methylation domain-containing protein [Phycisphaera mikurensis]MBB6443243.1 prepilin-type N-terminal cleavage/methylation domain-containing protein/prepilin-type processing-associated H-X9-DG protein [Phycisphaera mikurensis]BAM04454.1 hypothetical protein PSMK_22950 [Phycisphaera mikurensis NBRC 102666]